MSNVAGSTLLDRLYLRAVDLVSQETVGQKLTGDEFREAIRSKFLEFTHVLEQVMPPSMVEQMQNEFLNAHAERIAADQSQE